MGSFTKKLIILSIVALSAFDALAQSETSDSVGENTVTYGVKISSISTTKAFVLVPGFVAGYGKHSIVFGPTYGLEYGHDRKALGGHLQYQYYPNARHERIDFYFSYDVDLFGFAQNVGLYGVETFYWQNTVGYGFTLRILGRVYLSQSFGLGFVYVRKQFNANESIGPESFDRVDIAGLLIFGIGYGF